MTLDFTGYEIIPEHTKEALTRYVEHKLRPGSFLLSVLEGDLYGAVNHADSMNLAALGTIARFIENRLPANTWGSAETIQSYFDGKE